jgi:hypothetical protein
VPLTELEIKSAKPGRPSSKRNRGRHPLPGTRGGTTNAGDKKGRNSTKKPYRLFDSGGLCLEVAIGGQVMAPRPEGFPVCSAGLRLVHRKAIAISKFEETKYRSGQPNYCDVFTAVTGVSP